MQYLDKRVGPHHSAFVRRFLWAAAGLLFWALPAFAGGSTIAVIDGDGPVCEESGPESPVIRLTSDEIIAALGNFLADRPQTLVLTQKHWHRAAGEWAGAGAEWINIAFVDGRIKFCGQNEREKYFRAVLEELRKPKPDLRVFVICLFHSRSDALLAQLEKLSVSEKNDAAFLANLERAKRHILRQRKTPTPYPTETEIKRIEKEWAAAAGVQ